MYVILYSCYTSRQKPTRLPKPTNTRILAYIGRIGETTHFQLAETDLNTQATTTCNDGFVAQMGRPAPSVQQHVLARPTSSN